MGGVAVLAVAECFGRVLLALVTGNEHQRLAAGEPLPLVLGYCEVERVEGPQRVAEQQEPGAAQRAFDDEREHARLAPDRGGAC